MRSDREEVIRLDKDSNGRDNKRKIEDILRDDSMNLSDLEMKEYIEGSKSFPEFFGHLPIYLSLRSKDISGNEYKVLDIGHYYNEMLTTMYALLFGYVSFFLLKNDYVIDFDLPDPTKKETRDFIKSVIKLDDQLEFNVENWQYVNLQNPNKTMNIFLVYGAKDEQYGISLPSISKFHNMIVDEEEIETYIIFDPVIFKECTERINEIKQRLKEKEFKDVIFYDPEVFVKKILKASDSDFEEWKRDYLEEAVEKYNVKYKLEDLLSNGETSNIEFKQTLRINLHTKKTDRKIQLGCLKTIAAFLNTKGGVLLIGVSDEGKPVGIKGDKFPDEDKMYLHLSHLIRDKIGPQYMYFISLRFEDLRRKKVMVIECYPSFKPVYLKDNKIEKFYIRTGNSSQALSFSEAQDYIKHRFKE